MSKILLYRGGESYELTDYGREKLIERWRLKNKKEMIDKWLLLKKTQELKTF